MELKNYEPKQIINLFYKILYDLEKHYTYNISKGNLIPSFDVVEEEEFKNDLLTLENACDTYKTACLENAGWETLDRLSSEMYFAFYDVLRFYGKYFPEKVENLTHKFYKQSKVFFINDALFEYYRSKDALTDRQFLFYMISNRLMMALKQPDKPYCFTLKESVKYEMGKYYILNNKTEDDFYYTIPGFVQNEKHVNALRDIVRKGM